MRKKRLTVFIIFLAILIAITTYLLKSRNEPSAPPPQERIYSARDIPTAVSAHYNDTLQLLKNELRPWDENFLITGINISFGGTLKELKEMYAINVIKPYTSVWLYSPLYRSTRMYEGGNKGMRLRNHEQDWSMYDDKERNWPADKRLPPADLGKAVEKCINYANQKGSYFLRECDEGIDEYGGKRFGWTCEFVSEEVATKTNYLFEFDLKTEGSYLCSFDSETQEIKNWYKKLPPP